MHNTPHALHRGCLFERNDYMIAPSEQSEPTSALESLRKVDKMVTHGIFAINEWMHTLSDSDFIPGLSGKPETPHLEFVARGMSMEQYVLQRIADKEAALNAAYSMGAEKTAAVTMLVDSYDQLFFIALAKEAYKKSDNGKEKVSSISRNDAIAATTNSRRARLRKAILLFTPFAKLSEEAEEAILDAVVDNFVKMTNIQVTE